MTRIVFKGARVVLDFGVIDDDDNVKSIVMMNENKQQVPLMLDFERLEDLKTVYEKVIQFKDELKAKAIPQPHEGNGAVKKQDDAPASAKSPPEPTKREKNRLRM